MTYVPLRGRVIVRPTGDSGGYADSFRRAGLVMPDTLAFDARNEKNQNSLGRGIVVAMGPPARTKKGVEIPPGFKVGDEVIHIGQHLSRLYQWNGEECRACSQEEVCGVIEAIGGWPVVCPQCGAVNEPCAPGCALADTDPPPEFGAEGLSE